MRTATIYNFLIEANIIAGIAILLLIPVRAFLRKALGNRAICFAWLLVAVRLLCPLALPNPLINEIVTPFNDQPQAIRPIAAQFRVRLGDALSDAAWNTADGLMEKEGLTFNDAVKRPEYRAVSSISNGLNTGRLAKAGMLPYCNIYSTFLQRAYDNIVHDVALQNLHVVLCIDRAGIVGNDGATHHGLLDLAYLRPIPNMQICAPRTAEDLKEMLALAENLEGPVAIRYPRGRTNPAPALPTREGVKYGKGVKLRDGEDIAVLTIGAIGNTMAEAIESVSPKDGLSAKRSVSETVCQSEGRSVSFAHYDMRWLKPLDEEILHEVGKKYKTIVTAEDGMIAGGLGSAVLEWMADHGYTPRVIRLGVNDQFVEHGSTKELYHMLKLDKEGLCESLLQVPVK